MAINRLTIDGFGQLELNNAAFRRDGRVEAQCKIDETAFTSAMENGMLVSVDKVNNKIVAANAELPIGIVYTAEKGYEADKHGLKSFAIQPGSDILPRVGYLEMGDIFTTNTVSYDTTEFTNDAALITALKAYATTAVYGGISTDGSIKLSATAPNAGPVLKVINGDFSMPDGQFGIKLQVMPK